MQSVDTVYTQNSFCVLLSLSFAPFWNYFRFELSKLLLYILTAQVIFFFISLASIVCKTQKQPQVKVCASVSDYLLWRKFCQTREQ